MTSLYVVIGSYEGRRGGTLWIGVGPPKLDYLINDCFHYCRQPLPESKSIYLGNSRIYYKAKVEIISFPPFKRLLPPSLLCYTHSSMPSSSGLSFRPVIIDFIVSNNFIYRQCAYILSAKVVTSLGQFLMWTFAFPPYMILQFLC